MCLLKKYLQYALDVSDGRYRPQPQSWGGYRGSWLLKNKVSSENVLTELPFADLTRKNGDRYEGLILTDDELYQQARSPKEAHAYLPLQLRAKQWPFERFWSREWWRKQ